MEKKTKDSPQKKRGHSPKSRQAIYSRIASHADEIIDTLLDKMRNSKLDNIQVSAANKLIDKILPNLTDLTSNNEKIQAKLDITEMLHKVYGDNKSDGASEVSK